MECFVALGGRGSIILSGLRSWSVVVKCWSGIQVLDSSEIGDTRYFDLDATDLKTKHSTGIIP